ncbi:Undecaprenyl-diphosphatase, partial [hydrothermal vent metagenome]
GGACVYKLAKNLKHAHDTNTPNLFEVIGTSSVLIGIIVATLSAAVAIKWLVGFLNKHGLAPFGWYRLALCAVLGGLILGGIVRIEPPVAEDAPVLPSPGLQSGIEPGATDEDPGLKSEARMEDT